MHLVGEATRGTIPPLFAINGHIETSSIAWGDILEQPSNQRFSVDSGAVACDETSELPEAGSDNIAAI